MKLFVGIPDHFISGHATQKYKKGHATAHRHDDFKYNIHCLFEWVDIATVHTAYKKAFMRERAAAGAINKIRAMTGGLTASQENKQTVAEYRQQERVLGAGL